MSKLFLPAFIAVLLSLSSSAQKKVSLTIKHLLGTKPFALNMAAKNNMSKDFLYTRVEYYISKITIIHDGGMTTTVPGKYILVNAETNVNEELGTFPVTAVEGVKFHIGVEAPTNNQDPNLWPASHPLSIKLPSMHWGWSSGYRFIALEGKAGTSLSTVFELHGLGNANYLEQTVMAAGVTSGSGIAINLDADYVQALKDIDVSLGPVNHGVDLKDRDALYNFQGAVFTPGSGLPSSVKESQKSNGIMVYPNPGNGIFQVKFNIPALTTAIITDIAGREIMKVNVTGLSGTEIKIAQKGFYMLNLYADREPVATQRLIVE